MAAIKVSESDLTVLPYTRYLATRRARKSLAYSHCLSASISRTLADIRFKAASKDLKVTIATADGPAHLPGMKASMALPIVIGAPLNAFSLGVRNSLLSVAQMPAILHSVGSSVLPPADLSQAGFRWQQQEPKLRRRSRTCSANTSFGRCRSSIATK